MNRSNQHLYAISSIVLISIPLLLFLSLSITIFASHTRPSNEQIRHNFVRAFQRAHAIRGKNSFDEEMDLDLRDASAAANDGSIFKSRFPARSVHSGSFLLYFEQGTAESERNRIASQIAQDHDLEHIGSLPGNEHVHLLLMQSLTSHQDSTHDIDAQVRQVAMRVRRRHYPSVFKLEPERAMGFEKR